MATPSSAAGKVSAQLLRASSSRRTTSGAGRVTDGTELDNGKETRKLNLTELKPVFSLEADVVKDMNLSDEGMQKLGELIEQVTAQTETALAREYNTIISPENMPEQKVVLPEEYLAVLKEAGLDCELTVQITEEYCKDITDNILPAVTAGYISLLEQQHVEIVDLYLLPLMQLKIDEQIAQSEADMDSKKNNVDPKLIAAMETFKQTVENIKKKEEQLVNTKVTHDKQKTICETMTLKMNDDAANGKDITEPLAKITSAQSTVDSLGKVIKGQEQAIYTVMKDTYPGVSDVTDGQKTSSIAMHKWTAPDGLTTSPGQPTLAAKMLASIQQICQGWIKQLYPVLMMITLVMANTDPLNPIPFPTIAEALLEDGENAWFGPAFGATYNFASSMIYELIARHNPDMIRLAMTPKKTGGDGDPDRITTMEPENGVSLLMYWLHHCEAQLPQMRRTHMTIMDSAYTLFRSGPIVKACDVFLENWRKATELGLPLNYRNVLHRSCNLLRKRSVMFHDIANKYINGSEAEDMAYNCTEITGVFLGLIRQIAVNLGSDNPPAAEDQMAKSDEMQFKALAGWRDQSPQSQRNDASKTTDSDWCCNNVECSGFVNMFTKVGHQKRQAKKLGRHEKSIPAAPHLLCTDCHKSWEGGASITLSRGKKPAYEPFNNSNPRPQGGNNGGNNGGNSNNTDAQKAKKKATRKANLAKKKALADAEKVELVALRAKASERAEEKVEDKKSASIMSNADAASVVKFMSVLAKAGGAEAAPEEGEPGQKKEAKAASPMDMVVDAMKKMQDGAN